jgi:hypothetical protein
LAMASAWVSLCGLGRRYFLCLFLFFMGGFSRVRVCVWV